MSELSFNIAPSKENEELNHPRLIEKGGLAFLKCLDVVRIIISKQEFFLTVHLL